MQKYHLASRPRPHHQSSQALAHVDDLTGPQRKSGLYSIASRTPLNGRVASYERFPDFTKSSVVNANLINSKNQMMKDYIQ